MKIVGWGQLSFSSITYFSRNSKLVGFDFEGVVSLFLSSFEDDLCRRIEGRWRRSSRERIPLLFSSAEAVEGAIPVMQIGAGFCFALRSTDSASIYAVDSFRLRIRDSIVYVKCGMLEISTSWPMSFSICNFVVTA